MLSQSTPTAKATATTLTDEVEHPYTRLSALLYLVGENPSTLEPLLHELRSTLFFVPVDGNDRSPLEEACLFCNEREGAFFGIAFLREGDAHEYFRQCSEPYTLMSCRGGDLLSTLCKRDPALGLYLVDSGHGFFLNADVMRIGASLLDFEKAEVEHVQYAPSPYGGPIPRELRTELDLFCSQHPHIERVYLSEVVSQKGPLGAAFIIVGDHAASRVNVQDILCVIADRAGLIDWKGIITWIEKDDGEDVLRRNNIDLVYARKGS